MPLTDRKRPRVGDVIEIPTPKGRAYAHYSHRHAQFGALIRVLPGLHADRPADFKSLVTQTPQFITFFPLGAACSRGIVHVVAHELLPPIALPFPTFRDGVADRDGKVAVWWLWDGDREWCVGPLSPGMEKLPLRGIWNDALLVERIMSGWRHENVA
jgi:hypothetical protein